MLRPQLISLDTARKTIIPRAKSGKPISPSTIWRWARRGVAGINGDRIRLSVTYVGSVPHVTEADVMQFFAEVTTAKQERYHRNNEVVDCSDSDLQAVGLASAR